MADAGEAADEAEDDDEFVFEFCDEYSEVFSAGSSDEVETNTLVADPDFSSCGMGWLDMNDSCHRLIQIELQRAKCRRDEAYAKLLRTPSTARSKKTIAKEFDHTCHQVESLQAELGRYEAEGTLDIRHIRSCSDLVSEIESLEISVRWLEMDLHPDQTWEVPEDRERALDLLRSSSKKLCNLKTALNIWDEHKGDKAEGCNSGVATKREGFPAQIRAMQEAGHLEAASEDTVDSFQKPQLSDEARPKARSKNRRRKLERGYM